MVRKGSMGRKEERVVHGESKHTGARLKVVCAANGTL